VKQGPTEPGTSRGPALPPRAFVVRRRIGALREFTAVLFDLDGTLCRHEQDAETAYHGAFEAAGVEPFGEPDELWAALSGPPAPHSEGRLAYLADGFGSVADSHGLLTNDPEYRQSTKLRSLGIGGAFDTVVYAGDMPRRKPHRDPFDRTVEELGVDASGSLYVGNSLEYDVAGAKGEGLRAAWRPANGESDPGEYDPGYVLGSPANLVGILDGSG